ncbi:MAG: 23S rRNA (pseudouridine(1915)-N(3))-methyltransferase RlmH [Chlamydiales bacterium]|nr:23S rRNA (pseudouridine(1915)-N(3))-methyltransferase RlmH [Chlamydiales bacterium]
MYRIKIFTIGKNKESWLEEALQEYTHRLKSTCSIEWLLAKDDEGLIRLIEKESGFICLDPKGKLMTSEVFSKWLIQSLTDGGSRLSLVIGGAEGLPPQIKRQAKSLISFSPLTFTHQLTRIILLEQVYRAFEINRGSPYHK